MHQYTKTSLTLGAVAIALLGVVMYLLVARFERVAPWDEAGRLTILTRALPGAESADMIGFGIKNVQLLSEENDAIRASLGSYRIVLNPSKQTFEELLQTKVRTGAYRGVRFELASPEIRTASDTDESPNTLVLGGTVVELLIPFTIAPDDDSVLLLLFETRNVVRERDDTLVLLPTLQVETRVGAEITEEAENAYTISEGTIASSKMYGMDWDGQMRFNYRAPAYADEVTEETLLTPPPPVLLNEESIIATSTEPTEELPLNEAPGTGDAVEEDMATTSPESV